MSLRIICLAAAIAAPEFAQAPAVAPIHPATQPIYRVTIVQRTTPAINYSHRSEPTKIDFLGTALLPQSRGDATIENRRGATLIDAHFRNVPPPTRFGAQYLTYVVWAISPDGRAQSIGELVPNGADKGHLIASTPMQSFALIVTAEPYFSVSQPSDVVVMENAVRPETIGEVQQVNATYELLPRKEYTYSIPPPARPGAPTGPEVSMREYEAVVAGYQAQNAIQIARAAGADRYAPDRLAHAEAVFDQTRLLPKSLGEQVVAKMREAAQIAEDARAISAKRADEDRMAHQQAQSAAAAKTAVMERAAMESAQLQARAEADRAQAEAARAEAAAEQARELEAENVARAARERPAVGSADRMRLPPADHTRETRSALRQRLSTAFETLDSPRGLVVIVPNARLENGPGMENTRERIVRVASDLKAFPTLRIEVDGHTDGGNPETARRLSLELAGRVRDMLVMQGIAPASIHLEGYGSTRPLASNASAAGSEQNRRVEIAISGEAIGNLANWDRTYDLKPR